VAGGGGVDPHAANGGFELRSLLLLPGAISYKFFWFLCFTPPSDSNRIARYVAGVKGMSRAPLITQETKLKANPRGNQNQQYLYKYTRKQTSRV
jgi:hypothetical protein